MSACICVVVETLLLMRRTELSRYTHGIALLCYKCHLVTFNSKLLHFTWLQVHQEELTVLQQQLADALACKSSLTGDLDKKLAELEAATTEKASLRHSAESQLERSNADVSSVEQALAMSEAAHRQTNQASRFLNILRIQCCASLLASV